MAIRLMIVDDSNFMRKAIALLLQSDPEIEIVYSAASGEEALRKVPTIKPDVISLDVNLPGMDGIETLDKIMSTSPTPIIMFSGITKKGAEVTLKALKKGAVDFVAKPHGCLSPDLSSVRDELIDKVIAASKIKLVNRRRSSRTEPIEGKRFLKGISITDKSILFIASSTGGVQALTKVIPDLPADLPMPVLIVQHMPKMFTKSLAESLDRISSLTVTEAQDGEMLEKGHVYIAPGGWHTSVVKNSMGRKIKLKKSPKMKLMPCADITMKSLPEVYGKNVLGVVLTGMGDDGTEGAKLIKEAGGNIVAQDEETSMIFGMPKSIISNGLADYIWPLDEVAGNIESMIIGCHNNKRTATKINKLLKEAAQA